MKIKSIKTGSTLVSSGVPDRSSHKFSFAYTGLFQRRSKRICLPVKCFYVNVNNHNFLIDAGWSLKNIENPIKHLGFALWFASEPILKKDETAKNQLEDKIIDVILMTHLDCDHVSGLSDFTDIPIYTSKEELDYANKNKFRYWKLIKNHDYRFLNFIKDTKAPFGKSCDVFGDGSVTAYLTPTHSAGSIIYRITDENQFALIVGDNAYMADSWKKEILPGPLYDKDNMKKCLKWIKKESLDERCIGIYCSHENI